MSSVSVELHFNEKTLKEIKGLPDKVMYEMARKTLDMTEIHIPMSTLPRHSGTLRKTTMAMAVRGQPGDYYITSIGSPTRSYASRVYNMNDSTTNWTTPDTHSKWFEYSLKRYKEVIVNSSIDKARKDLM